MRVPDGVTLLGQGGKSRLLPATAGGKQFANPSDVSVVSNVLVNGSTTRTWYLQPGSGPGPVGNVAVASESS